jgi:hypothetical protein
MTEKVTTTCACGEKDLPLVGGESTGGGCDCGCCGPAPSPKDQIDDLLRAREDIDRRLAELGAASA